MQHIKRARPIGPARWMMETFLLSRFYLLSIVYAKHFQHISAIVTELTLTTDSVPLQEAVYSPITVPVKLRPATSQDRNRVDATAAK